MAFKRKWLIWGLVVILGILVLRWRQTYNPGVMILSVINRGPKLTDTSLDDNGNCMTSPADCAAQASTVLGSTADQDTYSLARMLASEESVGSPATKAAIAWVALNKAATGQTDVTSLLTASTHATGNGQYGRQAGRYASTANDPYQQDYIIAANCISGATPDPTNGATHFFRFALQDKLLALGKVTTNAATVDANWSAEVGSPGFSIDGVDSGIKFYSPNGAPT